ncbi:MAG TPA: VWA domain-containing protein, partial [Labilithrix sp.]|nr:VWA domain-containing protein [Labilithrix sp.]
MLENRDYTLIVDKSGSMSTKDQPGGMSRWAAARESTQALAAKCEELDPDGLTLYVFGSRFRRYERVTAARVAQVFAENEPSGSTDLAGVLGHAFASYFERRARPDARPETIVIVTDGEPDDPRAVIKTILEASRRIKRDEELAVSLVQVGTDPQARRFLKL